MGSILRKYRALRQYGCDIFTAAFAAICSELTQGPIPSTGGVLRILNVELEIPGDPWPALKMSCGCYKIGGPWISFDPNCPTHRNVHH